MEVTYHEYPIPHTSAVDLIGQDFDAFLLWGLDTGASPVSRIRQQDKICQRRIAINANGFFCKVLIQGILESSNIHNNP